MDNKKPTLQDLRERCFFNTKFLADMAYVDHSVVTRMMANEPVATWHAEAVLRALHMIPGDVDDDEALEDYTLETVQIALLPDPDPATNPTLAELRAQEPINLKLLSILAEVEVNVIERMLDNHPVTWAEATCVLYGLSQIRSLNDYHYKYNLKNVRVALLPD